MPHAPVVFISSTVEDLKEHREQAAKAALACGFLPLMSENFSASGERLTLPACMAEVEKAELVIVLVAHRYGWVPDDPANPDRKSITWLECEHAWNVTRKEVIAFVIDEKCDWPATLREDYRLVTERNKRGINKEVKSNEKKLAEFKRKLGTYLRGTFTDAASVRTAVSVALAAWQQRHPTATPVVRHDPDVYLKALEDETRQIRIKGLKTRRAEPYFFGIDEIYIPLTTLAPAPELERERRILLEKTLLQRKIVLIGDAGSGKSTFLRRVAFELCRSIRGTRPAGAVPFLSADDRRFPILIRVADLARLVAADRSPRAADAPGWIPYFLGRQSADYRWGVGEAFFQQQLDDGNCLLMFDGLDEAPERRTRGRIARMFENATRAFSKCDFLVSTRPQTNVGDAVLADFHSIKIRELELLEIQAFFDHFARALALNDTESQTFKEGLETAIAIRPEIREMSGNAVMLTALAVLQHNDQRLPEYRVELYGSILGWLGAARQEMEGRPSAERCLEYMRKLALAMQDAPGGKRLVQISKREAAEIFARESGLSLDASEELLEREVNESAILSPAGGDVKFWHLSFQEYLAAREIASFSEKEQIERVVASGNLYHPEWRETMRLLGSLLRQQGPAKIEGFFQAILNQLGKSPTLVQRARCVALLGGMMRDLKRMGWEPQSPDYTRTVEAVMGIFQEGAESIDLKTRIEAAEALGQVSDPRLEENNWIAIPPGVFLMGAQKRNKNKPNYDNEAMNKETPVHQVTLGGFRICRYPVTVQEYGEFIMAGGYTVRKYWPEGLCEFGEPEHWSQQQQYPNRPVVGVSWFEASAYCSWKHGRLPTEAEWERVARGPECSRFPWGNRPIDRSRANYYVGDAPQLTPVGLFPKGNTAEGVCDMLGNVWEWCDDWFGYYEPEKQENPTGPKEGDSKILRGGSWTNDPVILRVSNRYGFEPARRDGNFGFRLAADLL